MCANLPRLPAGARNREPCAISRHPVVPAAADLSARLPEFQAPTRRLVTNQSVEATPGVAGARWYEIRSDRSRHRTALYQQGTYAPGDGVHRWMGSIAMDKKGNMALGYSVVNGVDVFPGIRYTGRLAGDPLGQMTLGEGTIIDGSGVQLTTNSRWGDYTDITVDPTDDCTFWYVNEYLHIGWADDRLRQAGKRALVLSSCLAASSGNHATLLERTTDLTKQVGIVRFPGDPKFLFDVIALWPPQLRVVARQLLVRLSMPCDGHTANACAILHRQTRDLRTLIAAVLCICNRNPNGQLTHVSSIHAATRAGIHVGPH